MKTLRGFSLILHKNSSHNLLTSQISRWRSNSSTGRQDSLIIHNLLNAYKAEVGLGMLEYDSHQYQVLRYLSRLCEFLSADTYQPIKIHPRKVAEIERKQVSDGPPVVHYIGPMARLQIKSSMHTQALSEAIAPPQSENVSPQEIINKNNVNVTSVEHASELASDKQTLPQILRGVYIFGEVGTGKTMLMDRFFRACTRERKRRVHFHEFLLEIHSRIRAFKQDLLATHGRSIQLESHVPSERDAITQVALQVANEAWLLCFDEFQVTDVADALILHRFFDVLWDQGVVLVATSNRPPEDLYKNGINRSYFEPFLHRLVNQCIIRNIGSSLDYRSKVLPSEDTYVIVSAATPELPPIGFATHTPGSIPAEHQDSKMRTKALWDKFIAIGNEDTNGKAQVPAGVLVPVMMGRTLPVPAAFTTRTPSDLAVQRKRIAWFSFADLCEADRGASDFQALCSQCHTVFIDKVPFLSVLEHDKARRFIVLIDTLYDTYTRVYWAGAAEPKKLFLALNDRSMLSAGDAHEGAAGQVAPRQEQAAQGVSEIMQTSAHGVKQMEGHARGEEQGFTMLRIARQPAITTNADKTAIPGGYEQNDHNIGTEKEEEADTLRILHGELASVQELSFAFQRAASRLTEMAGREYHDRWRARL